MVIAFQILFVLIYIGAFPRDMQRGAPTIFAVGAILVWVIVGWLTKMLYNIS